jgi:hypothetical protein
MSLHIQDHKTLSDVMENAELCPSRLIAKTLDETSLQFIDAVCEEEILKYAISEVHKQMFLNSSNQRG